MYGKSSWKWPYSWLYFKEEKKKKTLTLIVIDEVTVEILIEKDEQRFHGPKALININVIKTNVYYTLTPNYSTNHHKMLYTRNEVYRKGYSNIWISSSKKYSFQAIENQF